MSDKIGELKRVVDRLIAQNEFICLYVFFVHLFVSLVYSLSWLYAGRYIIVYASIPY